MAHCYENNPGAIKRCNYKYLTRINIFKETFLLKLVRI